VTNTDIHNRAQDLVDTELQACFRKVLSSNLVFISDILRFVVRLLNIYLRFAGQHIGEKSEQFNIPFFLFVNHRFSYIHICMSSFNIDAVNEGRGSFCS
jgi:hypothetical protein